MVKLTSLIQLMQQQIEMQHLQVERMECDREQQLEKIDVLIN